MDNYITDRNRLPIVNGEKAFTCPVCGLISHDVLDVRDYWCKQCGIHNYPPKQPPGFWRRMFPKDSAGVVYLFLMFSLFAGVIALSPLLIIFNKFHSGNVYEYDDAWVIISLVVGGVFLSAMTYGIVLLVLNYIG